MEKIKYRHLNIEIRVTGFSSEPQTRRYSKSYSNASIENIIERAEECRKVFENAFRDKENILVDYSIYSVNGNVPKLRVIELARYEKKLE